MMSSKIILRALKILVALKEISFRYEAVKLEDHLFHHRNWVNLKNSIWYMAKIRKIIGEIISNFELKSFYFKI